MIKHTTLLVLLAVASTDATSSQLRHRELWGNSSSSSSSSSSGWSFWGSLLQLLDHMHTPCPPGSLHHKDENGEPLHRGECWQDLHHPHHHHHSGGSHHSSSSGGSSGGSSGSSYNYVECEEGEEGCYQNVNCANGGDDDGCFEYIKCQDDDADCQANINPDGWGDDGHTDDVAPVYYDDDEYWADDGWTSAAYANQEVQVKNEKSTPVWPFLLVALVAGVVGVMFIASRRKRRSEKQEEASVGTTKSKRRLFSGFGRKKKAALNEDFDNEDDYHEMSSR